MGKKQKSLFEKVEGEVVNAAGSYYKDKLQKKIIKIGEVSALAILGMILISIGLAMVLGHAFPVLSPGYNFLLLGLIFLFIGYLIKM